MHRLFIGKQSQYMGAKAQKMRLPIFIESLVARPLDKSFAADRLTKAQTRRCYFDQEMVLGGGRSFTDDVNSSDDWPLGRPGPTKI